MASSIVPEDQTDADRIADFVNGYLGKNREQNRRMDRRALDIAALILAYKVVRKNKKPRRR